MSFPVMLLLAPHTIHSFSMYFVLGTVLGGGDSVVKKKATSLISWNYVAVGGD